MRDFFNPEALQSLKVRDFRLYFTGNTLSKLGTEMQQVALAWQIYLLTGEPLSLGLIGLVRAGPAIVFSIVGGALADSMSRRRLLLITQTCMLIFSALLALLVATNNANIWLLYLLTFLAAIAASADGPAHAAIIPSLVPRHLMTNAIALNNLSWSTAGIFGPALGGLVIGFAGTAAAFTFDALSFLAVIWVLLIIKAPLLVPDLSPEERTIRGNLRRIADGFRWVRHTHIITGLMLLDFFAMVFGASLTLLPVFAKDILKVGPEGLGLLAAAPSVGALVGAVGLTVVKRPQHPGQFVLGAILGYGACVTVFGLSTVFWISWLALAGTGLTDTVSMTMRQGIRQLLTPEEMRGRVGGINFLFAVSGTQLGEFEAGVAAQLIGANPAVTLGGIACGIMVLVVAMTVPGIRTFNETEELKTRHPSPNQA